MVEDLVKRGSESKEVARLIRRNPPGVVWLSLLEPWLVTVFLVLSLLSLFCARRERRDDKSRALMVCVESVIGEDVFVLSTGERVGRVDVVE
jgi:membrane protein implicated in regulation of membrane protease activity